MNQAVKMSSTKERNLSRSTQLGTAMVESALMILLVAFVAMGSLQYIGDGAMWAFYRTAEAGGGTEGASCTPENPC